ncbi:hypothetical protein HYZ78_03365 [Candidatus Microgenomates bacterium]|nr:hypothetical protein [Candidatus Microgenomates bacterium]
MLPKLIIIVIVLAGTFLLFKGSLSAPNFSTTPTTNQQSAPAMTADEVLALGGTCFEKGFIDETGDILAAPDGQSQKPASPQKSEFDVVRIVVGAQGNMLVSVWEFAGNITEEQLGHLNIDLQTFHNRNDRSQVSKAAKDTNWTGSYRPNQGDITEFNPQVRFSGNSIQFSIPLEYIATNGVVDSINFEAHFYDKNTNTMFVDNISVRYQPFMCSAPQ